MRDVITTISNHITPKASIAFAMGILWSVVVLASVEKQGDQFLALLVTTGVSLALGLLTLLVLPSSIRITLPYLLCIGVFYFTVALRPYFMFLLYQNPDNPFLGSPKEFIGAVWVGMLGQVALLVFLIYFRRRMCLRRSRPTTSGEQSVRWRTLSRHLFLVLLVSVPLLNIVTTHLNIGFMGGPASTLPFRLGGIIVTLRAFTLTLALFLVQCAFRTQRSHLRALSIIVYAGSIAWIVVSTSSRGVIVGSTLMGMFLYLSMAPQINYRKLAIGFVTLLAVAIFTFPFITAYRSAGHVSADAILRQYRTAYRGNNAFSHREMIYQLITRFTGIETLVPLLRSDAGVIGVRRAVQVLAGRDAYVSLGEYFGREVLKLPKTIPVYYATGFFGEFYLIGGRVGVFVGTFLLIGCIGLLWGALLRSHAITTKPIILAFIANTVLVWFSEGQIIQEVLSEKGVIVPIVFFVVLERIVRRYRIRRRVHGVRYQHQRVGMASLRASV